MKTENFVKVGFMHQTSCFRCRNEFIQSVTDLQTVQYLFSFCFRYSLYMIMQQPLVIGLGVSDLNRSDVRHRQSALHDRLYSISLSGTMNCFPHLSLQ